MAGPPYYILISQSDLSSSSQPQIPLSSSLSHPIIQYHYLDDSPLALFPRTPDEQVLLLDYDPNAPPDIHPTVRSVSYNVAVTGTKAPDAPGATAEGVAKNFSEKMYILETITPPDDKSSAMDASQSDFRNPQATLARFKQRNAILRRVLLYPDAAGVTSKPASPRPNGTPLFNLRPPSI